MSNNKGQTSSLGKGGIVAIIVSAVVIVALVIVIIFLVKGKNNVEEVEKRSVVVNSSNAEEVVDEMVADEYIEPGYYNASMTNVWHFATGDAESSDAYVANVKENTNDVFFDVFLASDEEHPILQSPVIPRGSELDKIKLDTPLDAGTHDCVLVYHLVDENQKTVSTLRVGITIIVEK